MIEDLLETAGAEPPRRRGRGLLKLLAFLIALTLAFGGFGLYALSQAKGTSSGMPVTVEIAEGATASSIADMLAEKGVVRSGWLFKIVARFRGSASSLKPGAYEMRTGMSFEAVLDLLEKGPAIEFVRLTIPEGRTVGQVADIVEDRLGIPKKEFLQAATSGAHRTGILPAGSKNLEGLLYPDTYFVKKDAGAAEVVARLIEEFETKTAALDFSKAKSLGLTPYQAIVLASLVEREAKVQEDRPKIAAVMYNRLKRGMRLEIDATVQYAMFLRDGVMPTNVTLEDLQIASPYNTYKIPALPPAPIAAPGLASIQAALAPATNDFIFYVLSTDGKKHCFARTYNEFLAYKNRHRTCV